MEVAATNSEFFHESSIFEHKQDEDDFLEQSLNEIDKTLAQLKLKNLAESGILPNLQLYASHVKKYGKKKKSRRHHDERKQETDLGGNKDFKDDWSKQSCDEFFVPVESFLKETQLKREKSSKRRCKIIELNRNIENNRKYIEDKIHEYDEKISMNLLLKNSKSCSLQVNASMNMGQLNYRALIAEEIIRKNARCNRCADRSRRYEDNYFLRSISYGLNGKSKKKNNLLSFPSLVPRVHASQGVFSHNSYQQAHQPPPHLQFQENSYRNFSDTTNESVLKSSFNSLSNLMNANPNPNPFSSNRRPLMNKTPIEVQKKSVF